MTYSFVSCDELVQACAEGNAEAWTEFVRRFGPVINAAIWRIALRHGDNNCATIAELVQDTYVKFLDNHCRILRQFKSHHENSFYGMAGKVATNHARDHYRKLHPPEIDVSDIEGFMPDPHASGTDHLEQQRKLEKIDRILRTQCSPRDREIFWLNHGANGFTNTEIARMSRFNLNEKGVQSVLHRLKCMVLRKLAGEDEDGNRDPDKAA